MKPVIYTVGHSTVPSGTIVDLLLAHEVTAVADVRSVPYSRSNSQFNREKFKSELERAKIAYSFLGLELGARTDDPSCYIKQQVQYELLARTQHFQSGLTRVEEGIRRGYRIALMCAERDPLTCHRGILISRHLVRRGIDVQHILGGGSLEPHDKALDRLIREIAATNKNHDLFKSRDALVEEAYGIRGHEIAYVESAEVSGVLPEAT